MSSEKLTKDKVIAIVQEYLESGCGGHKIETPNGVEYDCHYDMGISCEECIFGPCNGKTDPRERLDVDIIEFMFHNLLEKG